MSFGPTRSRPARSSLPRLRPGRGGSRPFPVSVEGNRTHLELGVTFSKSSPFFLFLDPPAVRRLPAKLYEYLRAGRPTFAIVPRGGAADQWLARTGAGMSVDSAVPTLWSPALKAFLESLDHYPPPSAEPFFRRPLTQRLARILDEGEK